MWKDYCSWHDKKLRDVTEHEQEQCSESGKKDCTDCPDLVSKKHDREEA